MSKTTQYLLYLEPRPFTRSFANNSLDHDAKVSVEEGRFEEFFANTHIGSNIYLHLMFHGELYVSGKLTNLKYW